MTWPAVNQSAPPVIPPIFLDLGDVWIEDVQFGADPALADNGPAINAAIAYATANGGVVRARALNYPITTKVTFTCPVFMPGTIFTASGFAGVVCELSTGGVNPTTTINSIWAVFPTIINASKLHPGWGAAGVNQTIGLRVVGAQDCYLDVPHVEGFQWGVQFTSYSSGCYYNHTRLGHIYDNKIQLHLVAGDAGSFVNNNNFYSGDLRYPSSEGVAVAGTRDIFVDNAAFDGNFFTGMSVEGDVVQYVIEDSGLYNQYNNIRYENTTPNVLLNNANSRAMFIGGYKLENIVLSGTGALQATIFSAEQLTFCYSGGTGGCFRGRNTGSLFSPAFSSFDTNANPVTSATNQWVGALTGLGVEAKAYSDAFSAIRMGNDRRFYIGGGNVNVTGYPSIFAQSTTEWRINGDFTFSGQTYAAVRLRMGANNFEWVDTTGRHRLKTGTPTSDTDGLPFGFTQATTTGGRPGTPITGQRVFDTTLGIPIWWNGAAWVNAVGVAV